MAGTVTVTESPSIEGLHKVTFTWLSSAGGAADGATTGAYTGEIIRAVQVPDAAGTQPTDLYDVVVNDGDGADVLHALGANISNAAPTNKAPKDGLGAVHTSVLTLAVTNAGTAKGGKTILYVK